MQEPKAKLINRKRDLMRWAEKHELPFRMPDEFPIKTSRALRGALAMRRWGAEQDYLHAVFSRYWEHNDPSVAELSTLQIIATDLGAPADDFLAEVESDHIRQQLIDCTNAALERGVFGAPSMLIGDELFWGKDRMEFVEDALPR